MENLKRQNFIAIFERYAVDKLYNAKLYLRDIRNEQGIMVKARYWLKLEVARELVDNLAPGEEVAFSAILEVTPHYADGFKLLEPVVLTDK